MKTSIVIPNYNGKKLLERNLPHVLQAADGAEIVVVDDGSTDGSCPFLTKQYPGIVMVKLPKNRGFATAVNAGVAVATGDIVVLLNTDIVPKENFLKPLLSHFTKPDVFAVGCMDESVEGQSIVHRGRGIGSFARGFLAHALGAPSKTDTLWVSGGSGAFRKSLWDKLGGMDELYNPFYWEDIDLSYVAQKAGYRVLFEPRSVVEHHHTAGAVQQHFSKFEIQKIVYRNQFIFVWKNITDAHLILKHLAWLPYNLFIAGVRADTAFFAAFVAALIQLPSILKSRVAVGRLWQKHDAEILA